MVELDNLRTRISFVNDTTEPAGRPPQNSLVGSYLFLIQTFFSIKISPKGSTLTAPRARSIMHFDFGF